MDNSGELNASDRRAVIFPKPLYPQTFQLSSPKPHIYQTVISRIAPNQAIFLSKNQAKRFKRFGKYLEIREKGLKGLYIILGGFGTLS